MRKGKDGFYCRYIKRILDICCALAAMIVFCWLYAIVAILVRVNLGKPVLYTAERIGKDGQPFRLVKFRSMSNAKNKDGKLLPDAQRLTKFGRILRASSLDELPEAWNILKGDMSVIGPRPWNMTDYKYFNEAERVRFQVRPGLSGLAQARSRTASDWDKRIALDLQYIERLSFAFDFRIVVETVISVILHKNVADGEVHGNFADFRKKQWETGEVENPVSK